MNQMEDSQSAGNVEWVFARKNHRKLGLWHDGTSYLSQAVTVQYPCPMPTRDGTSSVWVLVSSHHKMPFQNICVQRPRLNILNRILEDPPVPAHCPHQHHNTPKRHLFCKCECFLLSSNQKWDIILDDKR